MFKRKHTLKLSTFELVLSHIAHFIFGGIIGFALVQLVIKIFG